jgi:thiol-disulfide isomerase/thioredoxin
MVKLAIAPLFIVVALQSLAARGGETVLLDFASPYCGPCQQMMPTVESLQQAGYPIRRVDVTREPELASRFHVDRVPCFVMLSDGNEVDRVLGATDRGRLEQMIVRAGGRRGDNPTAGARTASPELHVSAGGPSGNLPRPSLTSAPPTNVSPAGNEAWTGAGGPGRSMPAPSGAEDISSRDPLAANLITSSVRLRVDDPAGRSFGTGTIIDARSGEALIITCGHLFRDSKGQGPVTVDLFTAGPDGPRTIGQVTGQIISYNLDRDIGLVSIRPGRSVRVAPIAKTQTIVDRGTRVISVGCDHGKDPTALASRVSATNRYQGSPNIEASGAPVEGRSGGGLFDSEGQLIGICFAADYEGNEGLYTALETVHDELDRLGLSDVYRGPTAKQPSNNQVAAQSPPENLDRIRLASPGDSGLPRKDLSAQSQLGSGPIVRGQDPSLAPADRPGITSIASTVGSPASVGGPATQPNLNPAEQAAWEELMKSASSSEVVCIIRPKDPGGKSEVITLDSVSPDFVRAIASHTVGASSTMSR